MGYTWVFILQSIICKHYACAVSVLPVLSAETPYLACGQAPPTDVLVALIGMPCLVMNTKPSKMYLIKRTVYGRRMQTFVTATVAL